MDADIEYGPFVVVAVLLVVFITPTFIAFNRRHPNRWLIFIINMAFGATFIGWIAALVWALHAVHQPEHRGGGESGLNLFVNDPVKIQGIAGAPALHQAQSEVGYAVVQLEKLNALRAAGAVSALEYDSLKAGILKFG